jgi:hypothetical protein
MILFGALMLTIVLLPTFERSQRGELLFAVVSMFIIFVSVAVNGRSPLLFWVAFVLAGPALVLRAAAFLTDSTAALLWSWGLSAAVLLATMLRLLQDVFAPGAVERDRLFGCVTVYMLIGLFWCYLYAICAELSPGAFTGLTLSSKSLWVGDLTYFSFNVVTTLALTSVMPANRTAQTVVLLQEFAATFYMAFVIARLVGMYSAPPTAISGDGDEDKAIPKRRP